MNVVIQDYSLIRKHFGDASHYQSFIFDIAEMKAKGLFDKFFYPPAVEIAEARHSKLMKLCGEFDLDPNQFLPILCWIGHTMCTEQKVEWMGRDRGLEIEWESERLKLIKFLEKQEGPKPSDSAIVVYPNNAVFESPEIRIRSKTSQSGRKKASVTINSRLLGREILRMMLDQIRNIPPRVYLTTWKTASFHNSFLRGWGQRLFAFMAKEAGFNPGRNFEFIAKLYFILGFPLRAKNYRKRKAHSDKEDQTLRIKDPWSLPKDDYTKQVRSLLADKSKTD